MHIPERMPHHEETWKVIDEWKKMGLPVVDCPTPPHVDFAMWDHLKAHWGKGYDIVKVDQDSVPTLKVLMDMLESGFQLCTNPCYMYEASTGLKGIYLNQIDENHKLYGKNERPRFSHLGGTGFCKIGADIQKKFTAIKMMNKSWQAFDSGLFELGLKNWKCFYPLHEHGKKEWSHIRK